MAKRQPQLSLDDLRDWLESYSRKRSGVAGAPLRGAEKFGMGTKAVLDEAQEWVGPFSTEEMNRWDTQGLDRNHAASLAWYTALLGLTGPLNRGVGKVGRGTKRLISGIGRK